MREKITDKLSGESVYLEKLYAGIYGGDNKIISKENKRENIKKYKRLTLIFGVILLANLLNASVLPDDNLVLKDGYVVSINRPDQGTYGVNLMVEIKDDNNKATQNVALKIISSKEKQEKENQNSKDAISENILKNRDNQLLREIRQINNSEAALIKLPNQLEEGSELTWRVKNNNNYMYIILLFIFCMATVYLGRFSRAKKIQSGARESVLKELPDFINKIVLLLNAGLVFSSAFSRIVNYGDENDSSGYFQQQMRQIKDRVEETNSSLIEELKNFSARIQVRELSRTVNIIADNIYMGSLLVEKLQIESDLLWENRRKLAEEKNRIGETKLSFPLAIHLIVLISITIAPALITT